MHNACRKTNVISRPTIRALSVLVVVLGCLVGTIVLKQRHDQYVKQSNRFAELQRLALDSESSALKMLAFEKKSRDSGFDFPQSERNLSFEERARKARVLAAYAERMRLKYSRAANFPWLSMSQDPSPP